MSSGGINEHIIDSSHVLLLIILVVASFYLFKLYYLVNVVHRMIEVRREVMPEVRHDAVLLEDVRQYFSLVHMKLSILSGEIVQLREMIRMLPPSNGGPGFLESLEEMEEIREKVNDEKKND